LGGNRLKFGQGVYITVGHFDKMRVDLEKYSAEFFGVNADVERSRNYHFTRRSFTSFAFFYNSFRRAPYQPAQFE
jgi:hypothetical protein